MHDYQLNGSYFEDLNQTYIDKLFFIFNIEPLIFEKKKSKGICLSVWYENKLSILENGNGLNTIFSIFAPHFFLYLEWLNKHIERSFVDFELL